MTETIMYQKQNEDIKIPSEEQLKKYIKKVNKIVQQRLENNNELSMVIGNGIISEQQGEGIVDINLNQEIYNTFYSPIIASIGNQTVNVGETLTFIISADDPDGDEITLSASGLPEGASFDVSTGKFNWTPDNEQAGSYDITFTASDGELKESEEVTISVNDYLHTLKINNVENGYINILPEKQIYIEGETVELTAQFNDGYFFAGWDGDIHSQDMPLSFKIYNDINLTPVFVSSIQQAIDSYAKNGDVIILPPGLYEENIDFNGKNITLTSETSNDPDVRDSTIIDGNSGGPVLTIRWGENITLKGISITNGSGKQSDDYKYGGGLYVKNSTVNISNCKVENNKTKYGGGLYFKSSTVKIQDSIIVNNEAYTNKEYGDGYVRVINGYGGGLYSDQSKIIVENTNISNNFCEGRGSGIYAVNNSEFNISKSTINKNKNARRWGGISVYESIINLDTVTISGNSCGIYGNNFSNININNCDIINNEFGITVKSYTMTNISDSQISDNQSGGLFGRDSNVTLSNSMVKNNKGTGISYSSYGGYKLDITGSIISNNNVPEENHVL